MKGSLSDDRYAINFSLLKFSSKLEIKLSYLGGFDMAIYAYDNSKREVIGVFKIVVKFGLIETEVKFIVLDILVVFSLLLGRVWFHPLERVPSISYQKIKIPYNNKVVTIDAKKYRVVASLTIERLIPSLAGFQVGRIYEDM